jgi:hypothetical protein
VPFANDEKAYANFRMIAEPCLETHLPEDLMKTEQFIVFDNEWNARILGGGRKKPRTELWAPQPRSISRQLRPILQAPAPEMTRTAMDGESKPSDWRSLIADCEQSALKQPSLRLSPLAILPALGLGVAVCIYPANWEIYDVDVTGLMRAVEWFIGIEVALGLSFNSWFYAPTRRKLPTIVFSASVGLHTVFVVTRFWTQ